MNLDSAQLQIFVSLLLVLGALFVAFLCDFLKGNNEVLRERNIELAVRQEERERLARMSKPSAGGSQRRPAPESASAPRPVKSKPVEVERGTPPPASEEQAPRLVEVIPRRLIAAKVTPIDVFPSVVEDRPEPPAPSPAATEPVAASSADAVPEAVAPEPPAPVEPVPAMPEPALALRNLSAELAAGAAREPQALESVSAQPAAYLSIPPGMHEGEALERLLASGELFRGVAVAIGITRSEQGPDANGERHDGVDALIESVLEAHDAAFRMNGNEYLLLLPHASGAPAQRRLQHISEVLWDYQIRSMAGSWILFSWGSAEVDGQPLAEAVTAAREHMLQTKRNRERPPAEIHHYRSHPRAN